MKILLIYTFTIMIFVIGGCSKDKIPGVYRIDIQQGNEVKQDMINKLKPGMTKNQVAYVMGTPLLIDTFHPERWDYIYTIHPGNGERSQRRITLFFEDDKLQKIEGDTRVVAREDLPQEQRTEKNVEVPLADKKTGIIHSIKETLGLQDSQQEIYEEAQEKVVEPDHQGNLEAEDELKTTGPEELL
ncbi:MAG TPA: outer membrane protein assembly factor BamE [Methylophaga sp.]|nr:outer membrane protein assembly factor BamE [Methylophaga sp.]